MEESEGIPLLSILLFSGGLSSQAAFFMSADSSGLDRQGNPGLAVCLVDFTAGNIYLGGGITDMNTMTKTVFILMIVIALSVLSAWAQPLPADSSQPTSAVIPIDSVSKFLQQGGAALRDNKLKDAVKCFREVLRRDENNVEALKNLGVIYSATGDQRQARAYFEKAFQVDSLDAGLNNNLGVIYSNEKNIPEAIKYFERAVAADSNDAYYLTNLGREYAKIGRVGKGLPVLQKANRIRPGNDVTLTSLGSCFASTNDLDSAEYYFEQALAAGGKTAELHYFLGTVKSRLGKHEEGDEIFRKTLALDPRHREARQSLALSYLRQAKYIDAIAEFEQLMKFDPGFYPAQIGVGVAYALRGNIASADSTLKALFATDSALGFQMMDIVRQERLKTKSENKSN